MKKIYDMTAMFRSMFYPTLALSPKLHPVKFMITLSSENSSLDLLRDGEYTTVDDEVDDEVEDDDEVDDDEYADKAFVSTAAFLCKVTPDPAM
jgi:non-homologous end joining protein Ku